MLTSAERDIKLVAEAMYDCHGYIGAVEYVQEIQLTCLKTVANMTAYEFYHKVESELFHIARRNKFFKEI